MNSAAVAAAIAGRFSGVTASVSGVTESLSHCTASLPDNIGKGPALLVYPPTGELSIGLRLREDILDFPVRLLRDPLSMPARTDALYAWYDAIRDRVEADMDLGLSYVAWAKPIALRAAIDGQSYSNTAGVFALYDVVELIVQVRFNEVVSTLAI